MLARHIVNICVKPQSVCALGGILLYKSSGVYNALCTQQKPAHLPSTSARLHKPAIWCCHHMVFSITKSENISGLLTIRHESNAVAWSPVRQGMVPTLKTLCINLGEVGVLG